MQLESQIKKVKAVQDESGHWYVIPAEMSEEFDKDQEDEEMCDSGEFGSKWDDYRTGGDLNLTQLWTAV